MSNGAAPLESRQRASGLSPRLGRIPLGRLTLAVLLGIGIWLARTIAYNPVETYRTTIEVTVRGRDEKVASEATLEPNQVTVTLIGQRKDISAYKDGRLTLRASVQFADMTGTEGEVPVEITPLVEGVRVQSLTPERVSYTVKKLDVKTVPVKVEVVPQRGPDMPAPIVLPDRVTVRGEKAVVERIVAVQAFVREFDLAQRVVDEVSVRPVAEDGSYLPRSRVEIDPPYVMVQLPAEATSNWVEVKPELVGEPARGYKVLGYSVEPKSVEVSGPRTALEALGGVITTDSVDVEGRTGRFQSRVSLRPPEGVVPSDINTVLVTVDIGPVDESSS